MTTSVPQFEPLYVGAWRIQIELGLAFDDAEKTRNATRLIAALRSARRFYEETCKPAANCGKIPPAFMLDLEKKLETVEDLIESYLKAGGK